MKSDPCIYVSSEETFLIGVYVNDIILATNCERRMEEVKKSLWNQFEIKDLGKLNYFLGVKIPQDHRRGTIWIGQPIYTQNVLRKFGIVINYYKEMKKASF